MPETYLLSLMRMADALYREVLILTDLPMANVMDSGKVTVNGDLEGAYHYIFAADARSEVRVVHDRFAPMVRGWKCWMPPRPNEPSEWEFARGEASEILGSYTFDAVCEPNVAVNMGPNRDVIFSKSGVVSSVMAPNSGDGFWREVFRASNVFGSTGRIISREI